MGRQAVRPRTAVLVVSSPGHPRPGLVPADEGAMLRAPAAAARRVTTPFGVPSPAAASPRRSSPLPTPTASPTVRGAEEVDHVEANREGIA